MKPIGVILIGGMDSNYRDISNVEVLGLENCSVPELPEWRYNHGSFITWWGALAVCGGQYNSRPTSSDCLVLNTTTKQWEHGVLNNLLGSKVVGVASIGVGTYIVHTATISFLPTDVIVDAAIIRFAGLMSLLCPLPPSWDVALVHMLSRCPLTTSGRMIIL